MDLEKEFPQRYYLNLGVRGDRRVHMEEQFESARLSMARQPAVNAKYVRSSRGYASKGRYALALTRRIVWRRARQAGAAAVLLFEDDVVLHPEFRERVAALELPDDWGIFYFGCLHIERPVLHSPGIVRVQRALDAHAIGVRAKHLRELMMVTRGDGVGTEMKLENSDVRISGLHKQIPTYAAWPNLAWQAEGVSDLAGGNYSNYHADGRQKIWADKAEPISPSGTVAVAAGGEDR